MVHIHKSWKLLKNREDEMWGIEHDSDKNKLNWIQRLKTENINIPKGVADQWLWNQHYEDPALNQYNDIDLTKVRFILSQLSTKDILSTHAGMYGADSRTKIIEESLRGKDGDIFQSSYRFNEEVINSWVNYGTWLTPPIILDSKEFKGFPQPYLLMEGYSRLGFFRYYANATDTKNLSNITLKSSHEVWLVKN